MRDNKHQSDYGDKVSEKYNYVDLQHCFNTVLFDNDNCFIYFNSKIEKVKFKIEMSTNEICSHVSSI